MGHTSGAKAIPCSWTTKFIILVGAAGFFSRAGPLSHSGLASGGRTHTGMVYLGNEFHAADIQSCMRQTYKASRVAVNIHAADIQSTPRCCKHIKLLYTHQEQSSLEWKRGLRAPSSVRTDLSVHRGRAAEADFHRRPTRSDNTRPSASVDR